MFPVMLSHLQEGLPYESKEFDTKNPKKMHHHERDRHKMEEAEEKTAILFAV